MAAQCPACARIHFETSATPLPSHCAGCAHDLSAPVVSLAPAAAPGPPPAGVSRPYLFAGVAIWCAAGWLLLAGVAERGKYESATAVVKVPKETKETARQIRSSGEWVRYEPVAPIEAGYVVNGKRYTVSPGNRLMDGKAFTVWYLPDAPQAATETRPFGRLLAAAVLLAAGLLVFGMAFGVFGGLAEVSAERIRVDIPSPPPPPPAPRRWFAESNDRRRAG